MTDTDALTSILGHLRAEPSRTWSIIVTLYGDAVVPRGGSVWLGTVLRIFEAMEIGGNVVRTAMSRLAADGWLERTRIGRNAFYRLAEKGRETFADAERRIYAPGPPPWDGALRLAVLGEADREADRAALEAAGFAPLAPGVLLAAAMPRPDAASAGVIRLSATTDAASARRLAELVWAPAHLADGYERFLAAFAPLRAHLAGGAALADLDALVARLLLVHEYRRLVLRDPSLPDALLPPGWPGRAARDLCATVYAGLLAASERWLDAHALNESGPLPPPDSGIRWRFRA